MQSRSWMTWSASVVFWGALLVSVDRLQAQVPGKLQGDPVICNDATCTNKVFSHAYIDASTFAVSGNNTDFCSILNAALSALSNTTNYPGLAGVIDARGLNPANLTCINNPWGSVTTPALVLLPAGTIKTNSTWVLPSGTRLVGEGGEDPGSNSNLTTRTTLQAQGSFSPMIQMGVFSPCMGVTVEDLVLDGNKQAVDGIDNQYCQELSSVNHVSIYQVVGKGLNVFGSAQNSGPYSYITFDLGTASPATSTCAYIAVSTRGIHGMTCTTATFNAVASDAIQLTGTASSNSIEDVRIEGFQNGVLVAASDVVLRNILGDSKTNGTNQIVSVVNIQPTVTNVALIGITNNCTTNGGCGNSGNNDTIRDNATNQHVPVTSDPFVAMYVLGNKIAVGSGNAYSRYTTSSSVTSWSVGGTSIPSNTTCNVSGSSPATGSLYSNASVGGNPGLYVCSVGGQWTSVP